LEKNREGCIFSFDAIGSFEKTSISCVGNGQSQIQPILDGLFQKKSLENKKDFKTLLHAKNCVKEIFLKVAQKNIGLGDGLQIFVLTKKGLFLENHFLKLD
jgi:20S proteasome subunit beta 6